VPSGYESTATAWIRQHGGPPTHPDLAVLLTTSGSTGTARLVRLSRSAIAANAEAICRALRLTSGELAPTTMPFFHGYGLSVLNSHLRAGAGVLITDANLMSDTFWGLVDQHRATSFAAVAHLYELLYQLHWNPARHTSLRTLTQSGGRLRAEIRATLATDIGTNGGGLYVMYGQTEATARLAILPPEQILLRPESVGLAVPGSRLTIDGHIEASDGATGEVVFHGPSVMMGYADTAEDLARPDEHHGVLHTGDLGSFDADGYLYLHGRVNRIAKVQGIRVNLDHVENLATRAYAGGPVAAVAGDDRVTIWCQGSMTDEQAAAVARYVAEQLHLNRRGFRARAVDRLPTLSNNKIDYRSLSNVS
jgi:acyl-CoA synthetase (AMP-forming)/AMP-acid ligase II